MMSRCGQMVNGIRFWDNILARQRHRNTYSYYSNDVFQCNPTTEIPQCLYIKLTAKRTICKRLMRKPSEHNLYNPKSLVWNEHEEKQGMIYTIIYNISYIYFIIYILYQYASKKFLYKHNNMVM